MYVRLNVEIQNVSRSLPKPRLWNTGKLVFPVAFLASNPLKKEPLYLKSNCHLTPIWWWEKKKVCLKREGT